MTTPDSSSPRKPSPGAVDRQLRQALEPEAGTADRLVRQALATPAPRQRWLLVGWRPATLGIATVLLLTVLWISEPRVEPPEAVDVQEPAALRISNETGVVTVTTPAGSKMIILPGDPS